MNTELYAAMAKAFAEIEGATKEKSNPAFKGTKYADLSSVMVAIKPALVANGLWLRQVTHDCSGGVSIETIVCHLSGSELSFGRLFVPASKQDAQGYGSALTYARRYSLMTAFAVCPEDDDGNAAVKAKQEPQKSADELRDDQDAALAKIETLIVAINATGFKMTQLPILKQYSVANLRELTPNDAADVIRRLGITLDEQNAKNAAKE